MVDQNSNGQAPTPHKPQASGTPVNKDALSQPTVIKAGESMLIISLVLIFLVACTVSVHLFLKRRKRKRRLRDACPIKKAIDKKAKKKAKAKKEEEGPEQPELHSHEKKLAELPATPLCEMGESEPRHEMEDAEVPERFLRTDSDAQTDCDTSSTLKSERSSIVDSDTASQIDLEAGTSWYDASEEPGPEPESRQLAMYWSRGI